MPRLSKKAQAEQERIEREIKLRAALHWTETADGPDVAPPERISELSRGYLYNVHSRRVVRACSGRVSHGYGQDDHTNTQGALRLFSTRVHALRALRNAMEREFAEELAKIDAQIAGEAAQ